MSKHNVYMIMKSGERVDLVLDYGRRSRMVLAVSDGRLVLRVPLGFSKDKVQEFVEENLDWIHENLAKSSARSCTPKEFADGEQIMLLGETVTIRAVKSPKYFKPRLREGLLEVSVSGEPDRSYMVRQISGFLSDMASREIFASIDKYSRRMGLFPNKVTIKSMTASWGRCSSGGNISINYKVLAYPRTHIDYVCIHELSHLKYMDHSPRFWTLVETQCPDWKNIRASMRT